jgi:diguanylate cyclase (GGDEF)-like protein/PAS domain S-box-containing protein
MNVDSVQPEPRLQYDVSYGRLLDASTEVLIAQIDLAGRIVYVNSACRWLLGFEPEEMVGRRGDEFIPNGLLGDATATFRRVKRGRPRLRQRIIARKKDGSHVHLRFDATPMTDAEGAVEAVVVAASDVGEELASPPSERTDSSVQRQGELIERLPAVIYVAEPGAQGRWRYVSPQIEEMLGYSADEWLADPELWARRVHPDDRSRVLKEEEDESVQGSRARVASEYRMLTRDGYVVWVRDEAVLRLDPDGTKRYDGLLIDITERKRFESQLQFFAEHDSLTGLANRRRFLAELDTELRRRRRYEHPASVLLLDLDNLKDVNDLHGHQVGDALIRATAEILTERLRESDTVARLGGDEFAALLRGATGARTKEVAKELIKGIRERMRPVGGGSAGTGASVGVAELRPSFRTPDDVLAAADKAMYEAKRNGGGRVESELHHAEPIVPGRLRPAQ